MCRRRAGCSAWRADISFPSFVGGNGTSVPAATGSADYAEQVEFSGTMRGRIGYAPNLGVNGNWLFYATGGFAWSYDQFSRIQIAGVPAGGTAVPGTVENSVHGAARRRRGRRRRRSRV